MKDSGPRECVHGKILSFEDSDGKVWVRAPHQEGEDYVSFIPQEELVEGE